jgi:hypothetical protein
MANPIGSIMRNVLTALFAALAGTIPPGGSALAADDCLATPASTVPQGGHWYYRTDSVKHSKCWYLAPGARRVHHWAADSGPATGSRRNPGRRAWAFAQVERSPPPSKSDADWDEALAIFRRAAQELAQGAPRASSQINSQAGSEAISQPGDKSSTAGVQWEEPPQTPGVDPGEVRGASAAFLAKQSATTAAPDDDTQNEAQSKIAAEHRRVLMRLILSIVGASAVAGILQYAIFRLVTVRRRVHRGPAKVDQGGRRGSKEPAWAFTAPRAADHAPTPDDHPSDDGIRPTLRALNRHAA